MRAVARGERRDYSLSKTPMPGGQAHVFAATHKPTEIPVAFKRLKRSDAESIARMRREIEVGREIDDANVMPILDADEGFSSFVMPLAAGNLDERRQVVLGSDGLRTLVEDVCLGLAAAHSHGWVHRDIKPANILQLSDEDRWVVADWGLVRRPPGGTTAEGRTRVGLLYGTEGFAAPELSQDAHSATAAADIYSVGQLIGWYLSGMWPHQNVPLVPRTGPWRRVVKAATPHDPGRRPQSTSAFLELVERAFQRPAEPPNIIAEGLLEKMTLPGDQAENFEQFIALVEDHPDDEEVCIDLLPRIPGELVVNGVQSDSQYGHTILDALNVDDVSRRWSNRDYKWADKIYLTILYVASAAARSGDLDRLERASTELFAWDGKWDQWTPEDRSSNGWGHSKNLLPRSSPRL